MSRLVTFGIVSVMIFAAACSTTKTGGEGTAAESDSPYPVWYDASGFTADSLSFNSYSMAIAADSVRAVNNAEMIAKAQLEQEIGNQLEDIRNELTEEGSNIAGYKEFIIMLRNASNKVGEQASTTEKTFKAGNSQYRAFTEVSITREKLRQTLEKAFQQNSTYWNELSSAESFSSMF